MAEKAPQLIIRFGSHSEKEYLEKTARFQDGVLIGANLMEATPGATSSLIVKLAGKANNCFTIINPMTYAFGTYVDRDSGTRVTDLDWIKSDQKEKDGRGKKITVRKFKRSYVALASRLGGVFEEALKKETAITPSRLGKKQIQDTAKAVGNYQLERVREELSKDEEFAKTVARHAPQPPFVLAPYFYIDPSDAAGWTKVAFDLAKATASELSGVDVHAVICADKSFLGDASFTEELIKKLPGTGVSGVWLWFSKFAEQWAEEHELRAFRQLVEALSGNMKVFNLHGGFFSLALSRYGLSGTSHGIGYGEQKDVEPVIGQSIPTVQYYLPAVFRRLSVPAIERCFSDVGVKTTDDFFEKICDCVVCKGILAGGMKEFEQYGDRHYSTPRSKRLAQTPAAAKRCRYHFLLRRLAERDEMQSLSSKDLLDRLKENAATWSGLEPIKGSVDHLAKWRAALL